MPDKTQGTRDLYYAGLSDIAGGLEPWLSFLSACGRLAQHSFAEQVLIHHQRPNASHCASLAEWNERKFFVRSGAKSIAVLQDENGDGRLRFRITEFYVNRATLVFLGGFCFVGGTDGTTRDGS